VTASGSPKNTDIDPLRDAASSAKAPAATRTASGISSVVSRDICLEGELVGQADLLIEGRVKGRLQTRGDVVVAAGGHVEAVIEARNITIQGRVDGNIEAREAVEIQQAGVLIGDCRARTIQIREGARFEGRSDIFK
jgi:cytoskeletal protein CcmA (bactofilin family)